MNQKDIIENITAIKPLTKGAKAALLMANNMGALTSLKKEPIRPAKTRVFHTKVRKKPTKPHQHPDFYEGNRKQ